MLFTKPSRFTALLLTSALASLMSAHANSFAFFGGGISAFGTFTTGPTPYADALQVTSISGTFTDTNEGILAATITGLETTPIPGPPPFVPAFSSQGFSFDNLFYPAGNAPIVCSGYPFPGGLVDTYGIVFDIAGGYSAEVWSDGFAPGTTDPVYNAADADASGFLDYPDPTYGQGVPVTLLATPEPSSFAFLGAGVLGLFVAKKRKRAA